MLITAPDARTERILPVRRHTTDFIEAYLDYTQHQEAPTRFHYWTAISILAGALGRHVYLNRGTYKVFPNLYILVVGVAGLMKKSTSTGTGVELLEEVAGIHMLANQVTQASMIDVLKKAYSTFDEPGKDKPQTQSAVYIYASEFKNFTNEVFGSLVESLTDLYDCKSAFTRQTKKEGLIKIFGPCVNMLGCTTSTWLKDVIPIHELSGGFASRILFVVENTTDKDVPIPVIDPEGETKKQRLIEELSLISRYAGPMVMSVEARETFVSWYKAHRALLRRQGVSPQFAGYMGRSGTMIEKLSLILSANEGGTLKIEKRHVDKAIELMAGLAQGMFEAFEGTGGNALGQKLLSVYGLIRKHPGIDQYDLSRMAILDMGLLELRSACEELLECRAVQRKNVGGHAIYTATFPEKSLAEVQQIPMKLRRDQIQVVEPSSQQSPSAPRSESDSPNSSTPETSGQSPSQVQS